MHSKKAAFNETLLNGGRTTQSVVKIGNTVRRPATSRSEFVRTILSFFESRQFPYSQRFIGVDENNRDSFQYIEGEVPDDVGDTTIEQLVIFMKIVRQLHDVSTIFTGNQNQVICHDDLSPCNVVFKNDVPVAIIDWDSAFIGERWEDVTYIIWLWINLGSHHVVKDVFQQIQTALDAYGADGSIRKDFSNKLIARMHRVGLEIKPSNPGFQKIQDWVAYSIKWVLSNQSNIEKVIK